MPWSKAKPASAKEHLNVAISSTMGVGLKLSTRPDAVENEAEVVDKCQTNKKQIK
jgi:radical SAM superfamily enzyme